METVMQKVSIVMPVYNAEKYLREAIDSVLLIVTRSGGVTEYVDKDTALIIERQNILENLKHAISYMKEHPEVREAMSENARIQSEKYSDSMYYRNFAKMMDQIMDFDNHSMIS